MAIVERKSQSDLDRYLELYCEPLSRDEEFEVDNEVLQKVVSAMPEEAGFSYEELYEQAELVRDPDDTPLPLWFWTAWLVGSKAGKVLEENPQLEKRVSKFATHMFGDYLHKEWKKRDLIFGAWIVAPYALIEGTAGAHRLYRFKKDASVPDEVLKFFGKERQLLKPELPQYSYALTMMPAQTVDRAARGIGGWSFPQDDAPTFEDANNKHAVTYFQDGLTQEALRESVMHLNPRTADVWRLCTATILESWGEGEREPPRVWLDARQLCDTMGFKKHHKGGHHAKNVAVAARALVDLERFHITIPSGARQYPEDAKGKRKATTVEARSRHRVLAVMAKEEVKQLFDAEWLPMRWQVTAGDWIKAYPRNQFAPLFRALVELPGAYTPDLWAKAIGTELVWQYRQDEGKKQTQRVETMLKQACILDEVRQEKNKGRARDNFEKALDALQKYGICTGWEYNSADFDRIENTQRGWFDVWLQARVVVTPPLEVTKALTSVAKAKRQHRRRLKKA